VTTLRFFVIRVVVVVPIVSVETRAPRRRRLREGERRSRRRVGGVDDARVVKEPRREGAYGGVHAALRVEGHRRVGVRASRADAEALEQGHPERAPRRFAPRERHRGELFVVPREDDALDAIGAAKQRRERRRLGALRRLVDDERVELERAERIGPGRRERTRDDGRAAEERDALARLGRFGRRRKEKDRGYGSRRPRSVRRRRRRRRRARTLAGSRPRGRRGSTA
jgi:hypothetical protein